MNDKFDPNNAAPVPPKPQLLKPVFDTAPDLEIKPLSNWVCWRAVPPLPGKDKWRKVPYVAHPSRLVAASVSNLETWRTFNGAEKSYGASLRWSEPFDGVGFVFDGKVGDDGLCWCGIDLDKWEEAEQELYEKLKATYTEISPSGRGVHIIGRARPFPSVTCNTKELMAEAYCKGRYFTFSGQPLEGSPLTIAALPDEIAEVIEAASDATKQREAKQSKRKPTNFIEQLKEQDRLAAERKQWEQLPDSPLVADEPFDDFGAGINPPTLDIERFESALWGLSDEWLTDEDHWKKTARVTANEAMKAGGDPEIIEKLWQLLDKRSQTADANNQTKDREHYDQADNRKHYERFMREYDPARPILTAGSLYWWAKDNGWDGTAWTINSSDPAFSPRITV
jgi:primase-polymerase (primpol)-like protein